MPRMNQVDPAALDELRLPDSGVTVHLRRKATGFDRKEATEAMLGDAFPSVRDPQGVVRITNLNWNPRQRYARYLCHLAVSLFADWDAQDAAGDPLPISVATLSSMESEDDYNVILDAAAARVTIREAEKGADAPFDPPSAPSSSEESSPTPTTSLPSSPTS